MRRRTRSTRRAHAARNRRPQRVREFVTMNRGTTRTQRDAHRRRQPVHGVLARRARLRRRHHACSPTTRRSAVMSRSATGCIMGGFSGVHQFCKVGAHVFIANNAAVTRDVPPLRHGRRAAGEAAQRQLRRPQAARLHARADPQHPQRLSAAVPLGAANWPTRPRSSRRWRPSNPRSCRSSTFLAESTRSSCDRIR